MKWHFTTKSITSCKLPSGEVQNQLSLSRVLQSEDDCWGEAPVPSEVSQALALFWCFEGKAVCFEGEVLAELCSLQCFVQTVFCFLFTRDSSCKVWRLAGWGEAQQSEAFFWRNSRLAGQQQNPARSPLVGFFCRNKNRNIISLISIPQSNLSNYFLLMPSHLHWARCKSSPVLVTKTTYSQYNNTVKCLPSPTVYILIAHYTPQYPVLHTPQYPHPTVSHSTQYPTVQWAPHSYCCTYMKNGQWEAKST